MNPCNLGRKSPRHATGETESEEGTQAKTYICHRSVTVEPPDVVVLDVLVEIDDKPVGSPFEDDEGKVFIYPDPGLHHLPLHLESHPSQ